MLFDFYPETLGSVRNIVNKYDRSTLSKYFQVEFMNILSRALYWTLVNLILFSPHPPNSFRSDLAHRSIRRPSAGVGQHLTVISNSEQIAWSKWAKHMHVPFQKLRLLILNLFSFEELWHSYSACSFSDAFAVNMEGKIDSYPQRKWKRIWHSNSKHL